MTSPGLCGDCRHAAVVRGARSVFLRCGLAATDPRFARYPRLPVLRCSGFEPREPRRGDGGGQAPPTR